VFEGAREGRAWAIGVDADQHDEMPDTVLTSMVKRGDVAVYETIASVAAGRFTPGMRVFGVVDGAVDWVHQGPHAANIPKDVVNRVEQLREEIVAGRIHVPTE
jgi:basic membrane protein A